MLTEKEIMIGDWVMYNPNVFIEDEYEPTKEWYPTRINSGNDIDLAIEGCYGPIPLTTDILEKNGFEGIGDDTYQLEEKPCWFWVDFFNHQYGCEYDTSTHEYVDDEHRLKLYGIPSVHELQHALHLCGIEKEIEL